MGKGVFSQGLVILLSDAVRLDALRECLCASYMIGNEVAAAGHWEFGGPSLVFEYDAAVNGRVMVDIVARKWPDQMGDSKDEATLFGAWSMGHFGPFAYPGGLGRAVEQSWTWDHGASDVERHTAFVRIRTSYVLGSNDDAAILPANYDPVRELDFITDVAQQLLALDEAICYFNPSGEKLLSASKLEDLLDYNSTQSLPSLDVWCNIRMFKLESDWLIMDTVGNWQLDMPDHEAAFHKDCFLPREVDNFLWNTSLYILNNGNIIKDGDTMDGPGDIRWQAYSFENGLSSPPRDVIRWLPLDAAKIPEILLPSKSAVSEAGRASETAKKSWWKKW
ncbi:DUF4261 domain-containing protein [Massilia glaciei]|nr:DUF4261 domain-containing protein [Massilia glaciei]